MAAVVVALAAVVAVSAAAGAAARAEGGAAATARGIPLGMVATFPSKIAAVHAPGSASSYTTKLLRYPSHSRLSGGSSVGSTARAPR
eukprot:COSAG04_NODE_2554_length_3944_cov_4.386476_3_plen_87_part_00